MYGFSIELKINFREILEKSFLYWAIKARTTISDISSWHLKAFSNNRLEQFPYSLIGETSDVLSLVGVASQNFIGSLPRMKGFKEKAQPGIV